MACFVGFVFSVFLGLPLVLLTRTSLRPLFGFWIAATVIGILGLAICTFQEAREGWEFGVVVSQRRHIWGSWNSEWGYVGVARRGRQR
jgi:hypothetical protein